MGMKKKRVSVIAKGKRARASVFWHQGEDSNWPHQGDVAEEQARQDRLQEAVRQCQEEVRLQSCEGMVGCRQGSTQGIEHQGFLRSRWQDRCRQGLVRKGEDNDEVRSWRRSDGLMFLWFSYRTCMTT